ncbi:hypothetical protein BU25DRAFT_413649 [Macroventuria anomochaeta]|uniref:Uncharacterized protein n=1 Tax=Macroventuria anomochaeta TaxID=301207 RepID=A0ACB6RTZ3_9PLEO|nr:uncharacterized protein BU25DRAFT_413649 [Macroventuria anomochaeta]KAF2624414.1 hypothetical protein BU25DRAFT_413649 [Macroventuria anomochaeta]
MAPSRAYIPSTALIRALGRPLPLRCPFARPLPAQFVRGKKSKAAKAREAEKAQLGQQARRERYAEKTAEARQADVEKEAEEQYQEETKKKKFAAAAGPIGNMITEMNDPKKIDKFFEPPDNNVFEDGEDPGIDFYEEDLSTGKRRKVDRFGTVADRKRERETRLMIEESYNNPNYDDAELNKRLMDGLMSNPAFADLTEELKEIKESILTKDEERKIEEEAEKAAQPAIDDLHATMRMAIHAAVTQLINDPDVGDAKPDLQAVLDKMPETEDVQSPEFQALLDAATEKVNNNQKLQEKLQAGSETETEQDRQQWANFEKDVDDLLAPEEDPLDEKDMDHEEIHELMREMRDILRSLNVSGNLESELDKMLSEPMPNTTDEAEDENGVNFNEDTDPADLAAALTKLAAAKSETAPEPETPEDEEEHIPPELKAKVDKIMEDPRLMEKLVYIQKLIAEHAPKRDPNDLTQIDHELAPDPYEMEDSRTATLAQRMASARADPEHSAAMRRLRVRLQPPFNISPALKSFNQAIEFAYIGANDDVRRVLWRSYQRARILPTFLQNMNDDAWDILYYSQAVTWSGNQNRTDHLKMLLRDLAKVGKNGPPTHPSTLGQHAEAARLEAAQKETASLEASRGEVSMDDLEWKKR